MAIPATKMERLEARVSTQVKEDLERAASLQGRSLTDFIVSEMSARAREVIREYEQIELSRADQISFAEALMKPAAPNAALKKAAKRYRREIAK